MKMYDLFLQKKKKIGEMNLSSYITSTFSYNFKKNYILL